MAEDASLNPFPAQLGEADLAPVEEEPQLSLGHAAEQLEHVTVVPEGQVARAVGALHRFGKSGDITVVAPELESSAASAVAEVNGRFQNRKNAELACVPEGPPECA